jgi:hypothetical protein
MPKRWFLKINISFSVLYSGRFLAKKKNSGNYGILFLCWVKNVIMDAARSALIEMKPYIANTAPDLISG